MVDTFTMKLLMKAAPNYHGLSARFLNGTYAACPCRACVSSAVIDGHRICLRVLNAGAKRGYAFVDETSTCDAAKFKPMKTELALVFKNYKE